MKETIFKLHQNAFTNEIAVLMIKGDDKHLHMYRKTKRFFLCKRILKLVRCTEIP